jgi:hypothetical protein
MTRAVITSRAFMVIFLTFSGGRFPASFRR